MAGCCFVVNQRSLWNKWISVSYESNILTTLPFKENTAHAVVLVMAECDTHHTTTVASQPSGNALADIRWHGGNQIYFQCVNGPTLKGIRKCFRNHNSNNKTRHDICLRWSSTAMSSRAIRAMRYMSSILLKPKSPWPWNLRRNGH